jgi:hypothetical protein
LNGKLFLAMMCARVDDTDQNQERLQRMIRRTMQVIRDSEVLLRRTNKLLNQSAPLSEVKIKRPDDAINRSLRQS